MQLDRTTAAEVRAMQEMGQYRLARVRTSFEMELRWHEIQYTLNVLMPSVWKERINMRLNPIKAQASSDLRKLLRDVEKKLDAIGRSF